MRMMGIQAGDPQADCRPEEEAERGVILDPSVLKALKRAVMLFLRLIDELGREVLLSAVETGAADRLTVDSDDRADGTVSTAGDESDLVGTVGIFSGNSDDGESRTDFGFSSSSWADSYMDGVGEHAREVLLDLNTLHRDVELDCLLSADSMRSGADLPAAPDVCTTTLPLPQRSGSQLLRLSCPVDQEADIGEQV